MEDVRNQIDIARDASKNWSGEEMTTDGMLNEFRLFGHGKRADILDQLDTQYREHDTSDLRKYHEFVSFRRDAQRLHHTLRKAGR
jgi:hypothetical protein